MPTYVYRCPTCGNEVEIVQKISEKAAPNCSKQACDVRMETVIVPSSFILKGQGWAKDGYSGGKK